MKKFFVGLVANVVIYLWIVSLYVKSRLKSWRKCGKRKVY
jgi:hypothetical protein